MNDIQDYAASFTRYKTQRYSRLTARRDEHAALLDGTANIHLDLTYFNSPTIPPTARRFVQSPVNNIAMDRMIVHREPLMKPPSGLKTKTSQESADKVERWSQAVLDIMASRPPYFLRENIYNQSAWGEAYIKTWVDPMLVKAPDKYEGFPFDWYVPDSRAMFASLDMVNGVPRQIFEEKTHEAWYVRALLSEWNKDKKVPELNKTIKDDELLSFVEFYTGFDEEAIKGYMCSPQNSNVWYAVPIDGEDVSPNPLGFPPYTRGFSGYGSNPMDGDPSKLAVGILTGHERVLIEEARILTMIDSITARHAAPTVVMTLPLNMKIAEKDKRLDVRPGHVLVEEDGVVYRFENPPPIPPALMEQHQVLQRYFEAFIPGIVSGQSGPSGEAAISKTTRLNQASLLWESQYKSAKDMISASLGQVLQIIDKIVGQGVEVGGLSLKPDDIEGDYRLSVDIKPGNPDQERFDYLTGKDMKGEMSRRRILEKFHHVEDATQEMAEMAADVLLDPANPGGKKLLEAIAQDILGDWAVKKQLALAQQNAPPQLTPAVGPPAQDVTGIGGHPSRGMPGLPNAGAQLTEMNRQGMQ